MNVSPLLLETYFLTELAFKSHTGIETDDRKIIADDLKVDVREWQEEENSRKWTFELTVELPDDPGKPFPYTFRVVLVGFFEVSETYTAEHADKLARANAPAILYSAAREALATATGRGPYMAVLLPSVNFLPTIHQQEKHNEPEIREQAAGGDGQETQDD